MTSLNRRILEFSAASGLVSRPYAGLSVTSIRPRIYEKGLRTNISESLGIDERTPEQGD